MAELTRARLTVGAIAAVSVAAVAIYALIGTTSARASTWSPTSAETAVGTSVAHAEANSTIPGPGGAPQPIVDTSSWPANVVNVSIVMSTRKAASAWVDGSIPDSDQAVVVVRLEGDFSVTTTGPPGSDGYVTGTRMTVVADATSGAVLDFGLDSGPAAGLPNAAIVYPLK